MDDYFFNEIKSHPTCPHAPHSRLNRSKEPTWNTPHSTDLRSLKGVGGMNKLSKGYAVTKVPHLQ